MAKTSLPPGFRFYPTDVEIVEFYLKRKVKRQKLPRGVVSDLNVYEYAPWDLPEQSCLKSRVLKRYFFCPREKKYSSGTRMNRATDYGFWKITGNDRLIYNNTVVVGLKKTLIFHSGHATKGIRTDWVMHEYRLKDKDVADSDFSQDAYVLCVIFHKDGPGPRNGAQYGAPFEDCGWDEDDDVANNSGEASPSFGLLSGHPGNISNDPSTSTAADVAGRSAKRPRPSNESCSTGILPCVSNITTVVPVDDTYPAEQIPNVLNVDDDDLPLLLEQFTENDICFPNEISWREVENPIDGVAVPELCPVGNDIFNDLGDLANSNTTVLSNNIDHCYAPAVYSSADDTYPFADASFLELMDLSSPIDYDTEGGAELNGPSCSLATSSQAILLGNLAQSALENPQRFDPQISDDIVNSSNPGENLPGFSPPLEASNLYGFDCFMDMFEKENGFG